jgi:hexosaminidase
MKELIGFAEKLHITIVPAIQCPGHSMGLLARYPEFSCTGKPDEVMCVGNDGTISFVKSLLDEVVSFFPSKFIHIGGDEVPLTNWKKCPKCQARKKAQNLTSDAALEAWFVGELARHLEGKGRRLMGWDEILKGGDLLPSSAGVMSWHGGPVPPASGHDVVMTPYTRGCYFDYIQFPKGAAEGRPSGYGGYTILHSTYSFDPLEGVDQSHVKHVIGAQACLWPINRPQREDDVEWQMFPRLAALAESSWTVDKNWGRFLQGLVQSEYGRLESLNVKPAPPGAGVQAGWKPGDLPSSYAEKEWVVDGAVGTGAGSYEVMFIWESGAGSAHVKGVQLFVNDAQVSADEHEGVAGVSAQNNNWKLPKPATVAGAKVRVKAQVQSVGGDSSGRIVLYAT